MAVPTKQTACIIRTHGDPSVLEIVHDWPVPERFSGEVLVEQFSTCVNRAIPYTRRCCSLCNLQPSQSSFPPYVAD